MADSIAVEAIDHLVSARLGFPSNDRLRISITLNRALQESHLGWRDGIWVVVIGSDCFMLDPHHAIDRLSAEGASRVELPTYLIEGLNTQLRREGSYTVSNTPCLV